MIEIKEVTTRDHIKKIVFLAEIIIPEYYISIIPPKYMDFFLSTMQSEETIFEQIEYNNFKYYILYFDNSAAGYFGIQIGSKEIVLSKLYVLQNYRRKKIGKRSLDFINIVAIEKNVSLIELTVHRKNTLAIDMYLSQGFTIKECVINTFENGLSLQGYRMQKNLF